MMRFLAALIFCAFTIPAHASWLMPQPHYGVHRTHFRYHESSAGNRVRFAACAKYGNLQCGCTASMLVFGRIVPGLPAVSEWVARFSRTSPHIGAAAIWPHRHVEIVSAVNNDGTVNTRGSVGWRHVAISRLIFVEP